MKLSIFNEPIEVQTDPVEKTDNSELSDKPSLKIPQQSRKPTQPKTISNTSEDTRPSRKMLPRGTIPPLDELDSHRQVVRGYSKQNLEDMADKVEQILGEFGVKANVKEIHPGPVITRFEIELAPGTKSQQSHQLIQRFSTRLTGSKCPCG